MQEKHGNKKQLLGGGSSEESSSPLLICEHCSKGFASKAKLKAHIQKVSFFLHFMTFMELVIYLTVHGRSTRPRRSPGLAPRAADGSSAATPAWWRTSSQPTPITTATRALSVGSSSRYINGFPKAAFKTSSLFRSDIRKSTFPDQTFRYFRSLKIR